ncbi:archaellin/type IV pilin N-terminal domain-containing protein [Haladaptatus sp. NG-WS-4]
MPNRALSPVVTTVLLVLVTLVLAGTIETVALDSASLREPKLVAVDVSADADADRLTFVHRASESLAVDSLVVRVRVNDTPLEHQPPAPFLLGEGVPARADRGVQQHSKRDVGRWRNCESGTGGNEPSFEPGDNVVVRISMGRRMVAEVTMTAS